MLVALLAVLALILYACSDSGTSKKKPGAGRPVASGTATATTTASVGSAVGGASGAAGSTGSTGTTGASNPAGTTGGATGTTGAAGGTTAGGTTAGGTTAGGTSTGGTTAGGTSAAGGTTAGGTTAGTTGAATAGTTGGAAAGTTGGPAGPCQLSLTLTSRAAAYANGEKPDFSVAVVNRGAVDCTADLGPKSLILTVFSGPDRIWSSADCGGAQDLRAIPPGGVLQIPITWSRVRSQPGCTGPAADAALGTYNATATLATGTGPTAAAFTSQSQSFQLKTGS